MKMKMKAPNAAEKSRPPKAAPKVGMGMHKDHMHVQKVANALHKGDPGFGQHKR